MLTSAFFITCGVFTYGTFGLLTYTLLNQCSKCCKNNMKTSNRSIISECPDLETYSKMYKVCQEIKKT